VQTTCNRRLIPTSFCFLLALGVGSAVTAAPARAEYPDRPVHVIVPVGAGGGVDVMARLLAQALAERLHQSFVVENKPGAAAVIGTKYVIGQPADGYTLLYAPSSIALSVVIRKTPPYDINKDLTPIINVGISPYALAVNSSVPAHNLKEFIAYAKANPGKLNYSSPGVGSAAHLAAEMLETQAGIKMVHVPNKGMGGALVDLISGQVQVLFASVPAMQNHLSDNVRAIAMAEKNRSALLPDLPTMSESGLQGFAVANWSGLLGPAGLDPKIVSKLHDEIVAALATPEMKEKVKKLGYDLIESTPKEFSEDLAADIKRWGPVAQRAGIVK
jgi:tripartite-type tricarboxylate transporter receptor subunit TctC